MESHNDRMATKTRGDQPPPKRAKEDSAGGVSGNGGDGDEAKKDSAGATVSAPAPPPPKAKPNFGLSGALAGDARTGNVVKGAVRKHAEPADKAMPTDKDKWRVFVFEGDDVKDTLHIHRKSFFIFGRDEAYADVLLEHESCSKEHAVVQYRLRGGKVKPYLMDLESVNGTKLNGEAVAPARYVEILDGDVVTFGGDERDFVFKLASSS